MLHSPSVNIATFHWLRWTWPTNWQQIATDMINERLGVANLESHVLVFVVRRFPTCLRACLIHDFLLTKRKLSASWQWSVTVLGPDCATMRLERDGYDEGLMSPLLAEIAVVVMDKPTETSSGGTSVFVALQSLLMRLILLELSYPVFVGCRGSSVVTRLSTFGHSSSYYLVVRTVM